MTHPPVSRLSSEFDDFLYAPIGEDTNGMLLSVLSVLARSDLDPWQEAARLAGLPEKYATDRLAALIAALPGRRSAATGFGTIAGRLVALLPHRTAANVAASKVQSGFGVAPNSWAVICVILMALALGAQWVAASNQAPAKADGAGAPAATTNSLAVPPPPTGK
ncbi:MAG: hypothetical protein ABSC95_22715 [Acetobacteraceae bacterium]|jgi:hypothetical protein